MLAQKKNTKPYFKKKIFENFAAKWYRDEWNGGEYNRNKIIIPEEMCCTFIKIPILYNIITIVIIILIYKYGKKLVYFYTKM